MLDRWAGQGYVPDQKGPSSAAVVMAPAERRTAPSPPRSAKRADWMVQAQEDPAIGPAIECWAGTASYSTTVASMPKAPSVKPMSAPRPGDS